MEISGQKITKRKHQATGILAKQDYRIVAEGGPGHQIPPGEEVGLVEPEEIDWIWTVIRYQRGVLVKLIQQNSCQN